MNQTMLLLLIALILISGCTCILDSVSQGSHDVSRQIGESVRDTNLTITPVLDEMQTQLSRSVEVYERYCRSLLQENPAMAEKIKEARNAIIADLEQAAQISSEMKLNTSNELQRIQRTLLQIDSTTQSLISYLRLWTVRKQ